VSGKTNKSGANPETLGMKTAIYNNRKVTRVNAENLNQCK